MSDTDRTPTDNVFDDWLFAFDESLASGQPPAHASAGLGDSATAKHLEGAERCLRLLEDAFPRSGLIRRGSNGAAGSLCDATPIGGNGNTTIDSLAEHEGAPTALTSGEKPSCLGHFELIRQLGSGGCGVVYLARDTVLGRHVALKVPHPEALLNAPLRNRFLREAQAAAEVEHPNVVPVYEAGEVGPICYIASAYCPGPTLAEWLKSRTEPVPARTAASLVAALADGVSHVHARGVLHRDLKPGNILLAPAEKPGGDLDFVPRITDFGMAKIIDGWSGLDGEARHTRSGLVLGTPCYMAPEQASGRNADCAPTTDVYALGVILYEILTGHPPFDGASALEVLVRVAKEDAPSPARLRRNLHRDLETICLKCLQKDPRKRYETAVELADDLRRFLNGEPILARPVSPAEKTWRWIRTHRSLAGLTVLAAIMLFVVLPGTLWYQASLEAARHDAHVADELASAAQAAQASAEETATTQTYFALLTAARNRSGEREMGWTWDGLRDLERAASLQTKSRNLTELRTEAASCMAGVDLRKRAVLSGDFSAAALAVSPDGRTLAAGQFKATMHMLPCPIRIIDLDREYVTRTLTFTPSIMWLKGQMVQDGVRALTFSLDGKTLYAGSRSGWIHRWDLSQAESQPVSWKAHGISVGALTVSDGVLFSGGADGQVLKWTAHGMSRELARFSFAPGKCDSLCITPDGSTLIACGADKTVWLDARSLTAVREAPALGGPCVVTPNGQSLVVANGPAIHLVNAASGAVYRTFRDGDDEAVHLAEPDEMRISPDGSFVVSVSCAEGDRTVKVWEVCSGRRLVTTRVGGTGPMCAEFVLGGRGLVVAGDYRVELYDVAGNVEQTWVAHTPDEIKAVALCPMGLSLACVTQQRNSADGLWHGAASVWDVTGGVRSAQHAFNGVHNERAPPAIVFHPQRASLAYAGGTDGLAVWDLPGAAEIRSWPVVAPRHIGFDPEGMRLWVAANATEVTAINPADGHTTIRWSNAGTDGITGLGSIYCVAAGREWVLAGGRDGSIRTLQACDGRLESTRPGPGGPVRCLALASSGEFYMAGTQNGRVRLARVPGGEVLADLPEHRDSVEAVAIGASDRLVASASRDGSVRLYTRDNDTISPLLTLRSAGSPIVGLSLSRDGNKLAVQVQRESAVRIWHLDRLLHRMTRIGLTGKAESAD